VSIFYNVLAIVQETDMEQTFMYCFFCKTPWQLNSFVYFYVNYLQITAKSSCLHGKISAWWKWFAPSMTVPQPPYRGERRVER